MEQADTWRHVRGDPGRAGRSPTRDRYLCQRRAPDGIAGCRDHPPLTRRGPAAFHAGIHDILLIAYALAWTEFLGADHTSIGIDVEGHGRHDDLADDIDLSRTVGWFTTKYPVALTVGGLRWEQVLAGDAALGPIVKRAKEQLRALPDPLTYGLLRYLNTDVDLSRARPDDRIQLPRTPRRRCSHLRNLRRAVADQPGRPGSRRRRRRGADAAFPHRRTQRRHHRHRHRATPARHLDLGALRTGSGADQPAQPTVVRRPGRHLRTTCETAAAA